eukprot:scaffold464_cov107-Skeletonema_dohrnii-CCMP3373.AAC.3
MFGRNCALFAGTQLRWAVVPPPVDDDVMHLVAFPRPSPDECAPVKSGNAHILCAAYVTMWSMPELTLMHADVDVMVPKGSIVAELTLPDARGTLIRTD